MSDSLQPHGREPTRLLCPWGFSRQVYWNRLPFPSPGNLTDPGIELRSPTLQADSLLLEPPEKPSSSDFNGDFFPPYWGCIFPSLFICNSASLVAQTVKNSPAMQDTWVWSLGWEEPLEEDFATHPSILAWRIPMDRGECWATVHGVAKELDMS